MCLRCSRGASSRTMLEWGHNSSLCSNQDGPFHHWLLCHNSSGPVLLDKISAGLSSEATWCQKKFDVMSWISDTLLSTYVFHLVGMYCNQVKTSLESVHRWTPSRGVHKIGNTFLISLASNCAPQSSSLGLDNFFTRDILDIEYRSCERSLPFTLPERVYTQAPNVLSDASEKTMNLCGSHFALNIN